jgi:hypothetical protein
MMFGDEEAIVFKDKSGKQPLNTGSKNGHNQGQKKDLGR